MADVPALSDGVIWQHLQASSSNSMDIPNPVSNHVGDQFHFTHIQTTTTPPSDNLENAPPPTSSQSLETLLLQIYKPVSKPAQPSIPSSAAVESQELLLPKIYTPFTIPKILIDTPPGPSITQLEQVSHLSQGESEKIKPAGNAYLSVPSGGWHSGGSRYATKSYGDAAEGAFYSACPSNGAYGKKSSFKKSLESAEEGKEIDFEKLLAVDAITSPTRLTPADNSPPEVSAAPPQELQPDLQPKLSTAHEIFGGSSNEALDPRQQSHPPH